MYAMVLQSMCVLFQVVSLCDFAYYVVGYELMWSTIRLMFVKILLAVYVGGYCGLSQCRLCVFGKLCAVDFLVVCKSLSGLLQPVLIVVMMGRLSNDGAC